MSKKITIKYDPETKKPKKDKDDKHVKIKENGDIELISNDNTVNIPIETWNHGAGWNSITIEF